MKFNRKPIKGGKHRSNVIKCVTIIKLRIDKKKYVQLFVNKQFIKMINLREYLELEETLLDSIFDVVVTT